MRYISLFVGIGGFDLALNRLGHTCVWANEWDKYAAQIYDKNFREIKSEKAQHEQCLQQGRNFSNSICRTEWWVSSSDGIDTRDIRTVPTSEIPDHELLVGGFPCQAFSIAGKRRGFDDTRGTLFFEIARIAKEHQPMLMLLENVKGLISHDSGKTLETILETLQELGYCVNYEVHNSKDFGVPQNRERIFFKCTHIKGLANIGQSKRMTFSENIIQEWLFQLLLNNLKEVKKLQEQGSKDWVVGCLLWKEIKQNQKLKEESMLGGSTIVMEEKCSQSTEDPWLNIDTWLKNILEESSKEGNKYTTSTAIRRIIESKTYTFTQMHKAILLATVLLRNSSKDLWNEILSSLTLVQENTNYARINYKEKERIITESGIAHLTSNIQDSAKYFIVGHIRGERRPEVFPIGEDGIGNNEKQLPREKTPRQGRGEFNIENRGGTSLA